MILVRNLRLMPEEGFSRLPSLAADKLHISEAQILSCELKKRSLDARKKDRIHWVCSVAVCVSGDEGSLAISVGLLRVCVSFTLFVKASFIGFWAYLNPE